MINILIFRKLKLFEPEVEFIEKLNLRDNLWLQSTWVGVACMAKFVVDDDDDDTDCEFQ